ncbi:MAG: hypothetical protein KatS3mg016_1502 [Fimbriimonadales bacterium]|jgi:hypothetical protein|nr:MAG: hypothetical protein KatS3mg016_1502 [Fimbriimonadales bacterium]
MGYNRNAIQSEELTAEVYDGRSGNNKTRTKPHGSL